MSVNAGHVRRRHAQPNAPPEERGREVPLAVTGEHDERELGAENVAVVDREPLHARRRLADVVAATHAGQLGDLELAALEHV